jgi:hypothetical protein
MAAWSDGENLARERYEQAWLERERLRRKPTVETAGRCEARQALPHRRCRLPYGHTGDHDFTARGL